MYICIYILYIYNLRVVKRVERGSVYEVLEARNELKRPHGKDLKVAVPDDVQQVEPEQVKVEHCYRRAATAAPLLLSVPI
jgi:hypothetical protein